jgi:5,10-methylene-tetrahydrofolate dehydrogenase/methenyl tetrahydrofolate cyclohydrolase
VHDIDAISQKITELNEDDSCVGIIVQLPLPATLLPQTKKICSLIAAAKDVDGLG